MKEKKTDADVKRVPSTAVCIDLLQKRHPWKVDSEEAKIFLLFFLQQMCEIKCLLKCLKAIFLKEKMGMDLSVSLPTA